MQEIFSLKNHHSVVPLCGFELSRATKGAPCSACVRPLALKAKCGNYEVPDRVRISFPSPFQSFDVYVHPQVDHPVSSDTIGSVRDAIQGVLNEYNGLEASGGLVSTSGASCGWRLPQSCTVVNLGGDEYSIDRNLAVGIFGLHLKWWCPHTWCVYPAIVTSYCDPAKDAEKILVQFFPTADSHTFSVTLSVCCSVLYDYKPGYGCGGWKGITMYAHSASVFLSQKLDPPFKFPIKLDFDSRGNPTRRGIEPPPYIFLEEVV